MRHSSLRIGLSVVKDSASKQISIKRTREYPAQSPTRAIMVLRRRKLGPEDGIADARTDEKRRREYGQSASIDVASANVPASSIVTTIPQNPQTFHVTKFVILRLVGLVYFIAFLGAYYQNIGLMGVNGLVPVMNHMDALRSKFASSPSHGFLSHPSLYWLYASSSLQDWHMDVTSIFGITLSSMVVLGVDSWCVMILLWLLDFTIVTYADGTSFYSYGWESQLLETGFLSIWLCDLPGSTTSSYSLPVLWLFRWLCARISIGAGLIKLRGGECWQNKTCLYYHFETQPIPR